MASRKLEVPGTSVSPIFPLLLSFAIQQFEHAWGNIKKRPCSKWFSTAAPGPNLPFCPPYKARVGPRWLGLNWNGKRGLGIIDWNGENVIKWERDREQESFFPLKLRCPLNPHNVNRLLYSKNGEKSQYIEVLTFYDNWIHNLKQIIHL